MLLSFPLDLVFGFTKMVGGEREILLIACIRWQSNLSRTSVADSFFFGNFRIS